MRDLDWIYELAVIFYVFSLFGYFIDFLQNNRKANRFAFWLLSIVWILQTVYFFTTFFAIDRFPILTPYEGLYFISWLIVSLSLFINWFSRIDFFVFFANIAGFIMMSIYMFSPENRLYPLLTKAITTELFVMHIALAFLAYTAFTLSFVFAVMYFIQYRYLKNKIGIHRLGRFGSLDELEKMSFFLIMIGVPLFLISLIWGTMWGRITIEQFFYFDAKVITSIVVLIAYSVFLYVKIVKKETGTKLVYFNVFAYLLLLINVFVSPVFSKFHWW